MNRKKNGKKKRKESDFDSDTEYEDMCFDDKLWIAMSTFDL